LQRSVKSQLLEMEPLSLIAQEQDARFAALQRDVSKKEETAALFAYLRHPWPRSRVIAALIEQVPEGVELSSFHLFSEQKAVNQEAVMSRQRTPVNNENRPKLPPRLQDLADLRENCDVVRTVVDVHGSTTDDTQLHAYVQKLAEHPLFASAQLVSLTAAETPGLERKSVFSLRVELSPGYGQPGGPAIVNQRPPSISAEAAVVPAASEVKS
jgi:hypothetical protein